MNLRLWPEAVPFDPDDGAGSRELDACLAGIEFPPAALIVAGRGPHASEWAARAAIGLARSLADTGAEVLLADLEFDDPSLHYLLAESAVEGLSDVLLFGASLERVTVLPAGQPFEFIAAGGFAPDPAALMRDAGWNRVLSELAGRKAIFLGYAHWDTTGLDALIERVPDVVLLAPSAEMSGMTAFLPEGVRVVATIRPPREGAGEAAEAEEPLGEAGVAAAAGDEAAVGASEPVRPADEEFERIRLPRDEARQALIADLRASQRSTKAQPGVASPATEVSPDPGPPADVPPEPDLEEPPSELWPDVAARRRRASRRSRRVRLVAAVLLVGLATAAVWYLGFRGRDGAGDAPTLRPALAEPPAPPEPAGTPLGWSVAVEAQEGLPMALRSVDSLGVRDSSITFFVSPAVVGAVLWYRVLAGPLGDSLAAVVAMDRLVQLGLKRPSGVWGVRNTPLTFLLGRFRLRTDAVERMDELNNDGVPTYIVEVPYTRGEPWYHLYAGAYTSALEAEPMRQILQGAGLADSLVVRVGQAAS